MNSRIASVVVHCLLLAFTVRKYTHSSLSGIPLVRLMVRDGTFAFSMLSSESFVSVCQYIVDYELTLCIVFGLTVVVHTLRHYPYAATAYASVSPRLSLTWF